MRLSDIVATAEGSRAGIARAIEAQAAPLRALSHDVHEHPEIAFLEFDTVEKVAAYLRGQGFDVTVGVGRLPSAFTATFGHGDVVIGLCVEYDALPGIGHACGHHIILGAGLAAAVGLKAVADDLGITVKVIGTPAEEHGGGKVYLLQDGAFDDVHAALMVHPVSEGLDGRPFGTTSQAVGRWTVTYTGKASHAAFAPHLGVNAADAVVIAQVAVGLLRQQIPGDHRTNMVIHSAGDVTNIICDRSVVEFEVRAFTMEEFRALFERVRRCFEAGALATGCEMELVAKEPAYEPLAHDEVLSQHWCDAFGSLGRQVTTGGKLGGGSTDMGNVTQVLPGLHPWVSIPGVAASIHSPEFAAAADTDPAYDTMFESGVAMAWAVAGLMATPDDVQYLKARKADYRRVESREVAGEREVMELLRQRARGVTAGGAQR